MEDSVPVEMTESQKNVEQLASILGVVKNIWYGICYVSDTVLPVTVGLFVACYAIIAYENTVNDTKTLVSAFQGNVVAYGIMWILLRKMWGTIMEMRGQRS